MSLSKDDVLHVANLAHIDLSESQILQMQGELNDIFRMIEQIRSVDTTGIEPMPNPHDGVQRLRDDVVTETNAREENMKNAPEQEGGCFLVPQVIE